MGERNLHVTFNLIFYLLQEYLEGAERIAVTTGIDTYFPKFLFFTLLMCRQAFDFSATLALTVGFLYRYFLICA